MKPYVHDADLFMWNLHNSVGRAAANNVQADVCHLQWYYTLAAKFHLTADERRATYSAVTVSGVCTGRDDDPLVRAILEHQKAISHPYVDGRASPVPGSSGGLRLAGKAYFVLRLGARFSWMFPHVWPRVDLIPGCPGSVAAAVRRAVPTIQE